MSLLFKEHLRIANKRIRELERENAELRDLLHAPDRQALAYAIADELYHPSNGIHLSREGIAGVVFAHLCGAAIDAARKEAQP